jgi:trehalose-6-phosphatase
MRSVVFADIDGTLIDSLRALELTPQGAALDLSALPNESRIAARDRHGTPVSIQTRSHRALLDLLSGADFVVPVTGRSVGALERVELPFTSWRIAHHGAVVVRPDGRQCLDFHAQMLSEAHAIHPRLEAIRLELDARIQTERLPWRMTAQRLEDLTIEVCIKAREPDAHDLCALADELEAQWQTVPGTRVHRNVNNLALLPAAITKERAVSWVETRLREEHGPLLTFGAGDSLSDYGFMRACDYFLVPRTSQLAEAMDRRLA